MKKLMFRCPITAHAVDTGMPESDYAALQQPLPARHAFTCTACGLMHHCYKGEVWLEDAATG